MADEKSDLLSHQLGFSLALLGLPVLNWTLELDWTAGLLPRRKEVERQFLMLGKVRQ